jgi:hypothetical protein
MDGKKKENYKRKGTAASNNTKGNNNTSGTNGFKALGLSDHVYRGIVKMGFRVSICFISFEVRRLSM